MTRDLNKGISSIEYNYINLPVCVTFANGNVVEYVYDAAGTKRSVIYKTQPEAVFTPDGIEASAEPLVVNAQRDYCGNYIYLNGTLDKIITDNAYISDDAYFFYIKDYQGNIAAIVNSEGKSIGVNGYYPYGGTMATVSASTPYKYSGKELDTMNGLNLYDFSARQQDCHLMACI